MPYNILKKILGPMGRGEVTEKPEQRSGILSLR
jgi:hypothetical protein